MRIKDEEEEEARSQLKQQAAKVFFKPLLRNYLCVDSWEEAAQVFDSMSQTQSVTQSDFTVSPIPFLFLSRNCPTGTSSTQISWRG